MQEPVRINKYLSQAGICSRREADRQIEAGKVVINGRTAGTGDKVYPGDIVLYGKKIVSREEESVLIAVNKPKGIVCTAEKREKNNIVDYIDYPKRIYPMGRLDKDSHGLILMTNQGGLVNKVMRSGNCHEKEYIVKVNREITKEFIQRMASGVYLEELNVVTRPCYIEKVGKQTFRMILTQGMNRQIRRMCEVFHYRVMDLKRVRIMNIKLGNLKEGEYRKATLEEWEELMRQIKDSSDETVIPESEYSRNKRERTETGYGQKSSRT